MNNENNTFEELCEEWYEDLINFDPNNTKLSNECIFDEKYSDIFELKYQNKVRDFFEKEKYTTPLMIAIRTKNNELIEDFTGLNRFFNLEFTNMYGNTLLMMLNLNEHYSLILTLLLNHFDNLNFKQINQDNKTFLNLLFDVKYKFKNRFEKSTLSNKICVIFDVLLTNLSAPLGAKKDDVLFNNINLNNINDLNLYNQDNDGNTFLNLMCKNNYLLEDNLFKFIEKFNLFDLFSIPNYEGITPIMYILKNNSRLNDNLYKVIQHVDIKHLNINHIDNNGNNILYYLNNDIFKWNKNLIFNNDFLKDNFLSNINYNVINKNNDSMVSIIFKKSKIGSEFKLFILNNIDLSYLNHFDNFNNSVLLDIFRNFNINYHNNLSNNIFNKLINYENNHIKLKNKDGMNIIYPAIFSSCDDNQCVLLLEKLNFDLDFNKKVNLKMDYFGDNLTHNESLFIHFCKNTIRHKNNTLDLILNNCKINYKELSYEGLPGLFYLINNKTYPNLFKYVCDSLFENKDYQYILDIYRNNISIFNFNYIIHNNNIVLNNFNIIINHLVNNKIKIPKDIYSIKVKNDKNFDINLLVYLINKNLHNAALYLLNNHSFDLDIIEERNILLKFICDNFDFCLVGEARQFFGFNNQNIKNNKLEAPFKVFKTSPIIEVLTNMKLYNMNNKKADQDTIMILNNIVKYLQKYNLEYLREQLVLFKNQFVDLNNCHDYMYSFELNQKFKKYNIIGFHKGYSILLNSYHKMIIKKISNDLHYLNLPDELIRNDIFYYIHYINNDNIDINSILQEFNIS